MGHGPKPNPQRKRPASPEGTRIVPEGESVIQDHGDSQNLKRVPPPEPTRVASDSPPVLGVELPPPTLPETLPCPTEQKTVTNDVSQELADLEGQQAASSTTNPLALEHSTGTCGRPGRREAVVRVVPSATTADPHKQTRKQNPDNDGNELLPETNEWEFANQLRSVFGPVVIAVAMGFGGLLLIYIYSQLLAVAASLAVLPAWMTLPGLVVLGIFVAMVVLAGWRLTRGYFRLRINRQVRGKDIETLSQLAAIRKTTRNRRKAGQQILLEFVETYPLQAVARPAPVDSVDHMEGPPNRKADTADLLTEVQLNKLRKGKKRLESSELKGNPIGWIKEYEFQFQSVLDEAAATSITKCARWVGLKTATSPNPLVNTLLALYWSFVLMRDLCRIYNVRVGTVGTISLLVRVFFNAFMAGGMEDLEPYAERTFDSIIGEFYPGIMQKIIGKFAAKSAIGLANYFLLTRLGRHAISELKPLA